MRPTLALTLLILLTGLSSSVSMLEPVLQLNDRSGWRFGVPADEPVIVNLQEEFQTIHSFGASDCWSAKYIGKWRDEAKKNQIADLLFSLDTLSNGQPKGIGLSLWRINIGAGSYEQGDSSAITDSWRREECFLTPDGQYDWTKQAGSQWFLQAARRRGVRYMLGFTNSAPVQMTRNGKAFSPGGRSFNLKPAAMEPFADFLTTVADHFKLDYLSPINEPQWDWKAEKNGRAKQEGSPAENADIAAVTQTLSAKLSQRNTKTSIVTGETAQLDYLYAKAESGRGRQLDYFFAPSEAPVVMKLPHVEPVWAYHSYFTTCRDSTLVDVRQKAAQRAKAVGSPMLWQSEFGVLGDICGQYNGGPRHTDMNYGLYVAKVIHNDLTVANVTSWQWWLAINPYNYSDGLVYINGPDGAYKNHDNARNDGQVVDSKQLWAFGNYARFVRPGMKRIAVRLADSNPVKEAGQCMVSAYKDERRKQLVLVCINMTPTAKTLPLKGPAIRNSRFTCYTTSETKTLAKSVVSSGVIQLEPRSVVTLVGSYK
ncbi:glycoside hydrolase [Spirosoma fluviale]|uniref:O-Glycosyl hydrolase n=1 Tax=Spirosoma fluviale TaxID=1597977 RepID=A0A286F8Z3_9BACT|nr:glycoside hydrolase [Spirosoma fluviale]SOD79698.1 O-Glycosyl hydrolase [Spirosoma fluviale]